MKILARNMLWVGLADVVVRVLGFFITAYLARVLGVSAFGAVSLGLAALGYLTQLSGAGFQVLETRNVAGSAGLDRRRIEVVMTLRLLLSVVLLVLTLLVTGVTGGDPAVRVSLRLAAVVLIPLALSLDWVFQGKERFGVLAVSKILNYLVYGAIVFFLVHLPDDFDLALIALAAGQCMAACWTMFRYVGGYGSLRPRVDLALWREMLSGSLVLGVALLFAQSAVNLGPIVLGVHYSVAEVGLFSAGMKLIVVMLIADRVLNTVFLPVMTRVRTSRPDEAERVANTALKAFLLVILPMAGLAFVAAPELLTFVFGSEYLEASWYFRVLLFYFLFTIPNSIFVCVLMAAGLESLYSRLLLIGSIVLGLCVIGLSTVLGPIGAALGVAVGEVVMCLMFMVMTERKVAIHTRRSFLVFLPAGVAMILVAFVMTDAGLPARLGIMLAAYAGGLVLTRPLSGAEFRLLRSQLV